mmetsp:Transcript_25319/g.59013  ORF Transcript_25319/g.59013 Transcript_25319/m.59013 type:complete len:498 (-) Transcript_25319:228-1721(-)
MVLIREDTCFDGVGCDGAQAMEEDDADAYLEEHKDTYVGYLTMDSAPGYVLFAKLGTQMFQVDGYQCHIFDAELPPVESEDDEEEEDGTEDMVTDSGLFKTATLPEMHTNMTGFRRPGRGQGLLDGADITLFRGVDAADILQGGLGDCWLLSAFAAMAEYPQALMSLFQQKTLSDSGEYDIQLYNFLEGQYQVVRIDDRLPVIQGAWGPAKCAYVQPSADGELWTCLLEKAFATMFGNSYQQISGGVSTTAFAALCGVGGDKLAYISKEDMGWVLYQPVLDSWRPYGDRNFQSGMWPDGMPGNQPKSDKEFHSLLCEWDANNFIMCANSPAGSDTEFSTQGIVQGHAYTLIDAKQTVGQLDVDLVQVRNPWGKKEWTGDWSDSSPLWDEYPDVRDALKPEASEDGAFWISMEDFADNYGSVAVVFKDMGRNYEKLCNPHSTERVASVLGGALPGAGNMNLGVDLPRKEEKQDVKRRKKAMLKARKSKDEACANCCVA